MDPASAADVIEVLEALHDTVQAQNKLLHRLVSLLMPKKEPRDVMSTEAVDDEEPQTPVYRF